MKLSDMQKDYRANAGICCSGNRLCYACKHERRKNKRPNSKAIRRINKSLTTKENSHA